MNISINNGYIIGLQLKIEELNYILTSVSYNQAEDINNIYEILKREYKKMEAIQKADNEYYTRKR